MVCLHQKPQDIVSKIERGTANPSISALKRIAEAPGEKLTVSIAVSDGKYEIKIIKYNNINNYSIIQNIYIDNYIYSMISLHLLSRV